jgi:hypothetical protein
VNSLFEATKAGEVGFGQITQGDLQKALSAGSGTDSATMTGGRSLIPQDIESTLVNALFFKRQDFKLMNMIKTEKVGSTVHEYTRRNEVGDETGVCCFRRWGIPRDQSESRARNSCHEVPADVP